MTPDERVADFQARADYSPDSVYRHRAHQWRYIPIHPFADEPDILARLEITPASCIRADAYWEIDDDVVFFETMCERESNRPVGNYIRTRSEGGNVAYVIIADTAITRIAFESTMTDLFQSGRLFDLYPDALTKIGSEQDDAPKT